MSKIEDKKIEDDDRWWSCWLELLVRVEFTTIVRKFTSCRQPAKRCADDEDQREAERKVGKLVRAELVLQKVAKIAAFNGVLFIAPIAL